MNLTPESSPDETSAVWVWRSRPGLEPHGSDLRGLHLSGWVRTGERSDLPLMPFISRSEREHDRIRRYRSMLTHRVSPRPSLRLFGPTAREAGRSDLCRDYHPRLRNVLRLSQPLDAFLRFRPSGLVSCRWRSWASGLQRFSLPGSESHLPMTFALLAVARAEQVRHHPATRICAPAKSVALGPWLDGYPQLDPLLTFSLRGITPVSLGPTPSTHPSKLG